MLQNLQDDPRFPQPGPDDDKGYIPPTEKDIKISWFWKLIRRFWGYPPCNPNCIGEKGETGPQGIPGLSGPVGPQGPIGGIGPSRFEFQNVNDTLKVIFVNSNIIVNPPLTRDGKTSQTAYAKLIDAFNDIPYLLRGQRIVIDCSGHTETLVQPEDEYFYQMPPLIGEGKIHFPYLGDMYASMPDAEISIWASLKDSSEPSIDLRGITEDSYQVDKVSELVKLNFQNSNWEQDHYQGMMAQIPMADNSVLVLPVITNTSNTIEFASTGRDLKFIYLDTNGSIIFKEPSARFVIDGIWTSGMLFQSIKSSLRLVGLKITVPYNPAKFPGECSPLTISNTLNCNIDHCELEGLIIGKGNLYPVNVWYSIIRSGMIIPGMGYFQGSTGLDYHQDKRRRLKITGSSLGLYNSVITDMILDQENTEGNPFILNTCGFIRCTPLGHGFGIRHAHVNYFHDHANMSFNIRWCHILNSLRSGILFLGGDHSWVDATVIENSVLHGISCNGPGLLHVNRTLISNSGENGIYVINNSCLLLTSGEIIQLTSPPPIQQGQYGIFVADGGQVYIEEDSNKKQELDQLKGNNGYMKVGNLEIDSNFSWEDLRLNQDLITIPPKPAKFKYCIDDGSRISFKLLPYSGSRDYGT